MSLWGLALEMLGSGFCKVLLPCDPERPMQCWEDGRSSGLGFWEGVLPIPATTCVGRRQRLQLRTSALSRQAHVSCSKEVGYK